VTSVRDVISATFCSISSVSLTIARQEILFAAELLPTTKQIVIFVSHSVHTVASVRDSLLLHRFRNGARKTHRPVRHPASLPDKREISYLRNILPASVHALQRSRPEADNVEEFEQKLAEITKKRNSLESFADSKNCAFWSARVGLRHRALVFVKRETRNVKRPQLPLAPGITRREELVGLTSERVVSELTVVEDGVCCFSDRSSPPLVLWLNVFAGAAARMEP
jgi:hypothetical protein